jgi:hypothetical protein
MRARTVVQFRRDRTIGGVDNLENIALGSRA